MKMTFRWFGPKSDTVSLSQIKQIPAMTGLMGFLDYKAAGEVWPLEEIGAYINEAAASGLECEVIESVNVHEDIKMGLDTRDGYIANYIATIRNLAKYGVKVIVYNFMPVFDWLRTDLAREIPEDGSNSLYFDEKDLGAMGPIDIVKKTAEGSKGFSLPGWEPERLKELESTLKRYENISADKLRENLKYFLDAVTPVCEEVGAVMACHPDDPGWPIFNLPRIAHDLDGLKKIVGLNSSKANSLCLCTGSLGSNTENDIPAIIRHFGTQGRIACMHIRNVKHLGYRHFRESSHLSKDGDLDMYAIVKAVYDTCPDIYVRPDHGRMIWGESARPGYGLYDRALGACYLNGLWEAIERGSCSQ
ncbi:MAG: mannonate dehydratase [Clostridiales bacterium]|jgi:mannonate dehydratase|nr:mannonate dehydratase [Clostridiales bacterium]